MEGGEGEVLTLQNSVPFVNTLQAAFQTCFNKPGPVSEKVLSLEMQSVFVKEKKENSAMHLCLPWLELTSTLIIIKLCSLLDP